MFREIINITMFNHDYPDKETNTVRARFLRFHLEAMGLYTILQATESLEKSYVSPLPINIQLVIDQYVIIQISYLFFSRKRICECLLRWVE
jgi:hypothetical protein